MENEMQKLTDNLKQVKHKLIVLSGKGGVGKSTVATNLATALTQEGFKVGLLDIDLHGPSVPKLLNLENQHLTTSDKEQLVPIDYNSNLKVISVGFLLQNADDAVIWKGPLKYNVIKQFLEDVEWGALDYLVIDSPPGTGDEPLAICQLLDKETSEAIVVTSPQEVALNDVAKSLTFLEKVDISVAGIIENMSGFICPKCGEKIDIFKTGGGEKLAEKFKVPFLGSLPIDPEIANTGDEGKPFTLENKSELSEKFRSITGKLIK